MQSKRWLKKHHVVVSTLVGVFVSSLLAYFMETTWLVVIGFYSLLIWNLLRKRGAKWSRRWLPPLFTLSIFILGVGAGKLTDSFLASEFAVPTFRPVFVWHPTMFVGKILSVGVPRNSVPNGVILEMLLISQTSFGNESFAVSGNSYPLKQLLNLSVFDSSDNFSLVKAYPSVSLQGELVCLSEDCVNPLGNQL